MEAIKILQSLGYEIALDIETLIYVALEKEVSRFALSRDMEGLNEVLKDYLDLMVRTARIFKAQKGEIGNLFQQG